MKLLPRAIHNENDGLIAFLSHQVELLILCAYGLDDAQIRVTIPESDLTIGGLLKHVTLVEQIWIDRILSAPASPERDGWDPSVRQRQFTENFLLMPEDTRDTLILRLREQTITTVQVIANTDLNTHIPISPNFVSAYPEGTTWSARWVFLHLIEEISRHGGHADIIREGIDGSTLAQLAQAAESVEH